MSNNDDGTIVYNGAIVTIGASCKLTVNGKFGGALVGENGASLIFNATNNNSGYIGGTGAREGLTFTFTGTLTTLNATGTFATGQGSFAQGTTYYYTNNAWYAEDTKFSIEYKFRKESSDGTFSDISVGSVDNPNSTTYAWNGTLVLQDPSSGKLVFKGWFLDENGTGDSVSSIEGKDHFGGITLYGIFKELSADELYTINFDTSYNDKSSSGLSIGSRNIPVEGFNFDPVADEGVNHIIQSLDYDLEAKYYFDQWYLDEGRTQPYSTEKVKEMYSGGQTVTLYAGWKEKVTLSITLGYQNYKGRLGYYYASNPSVKFTYNDVEYSKELTNGNEKNETMHYSSEVYKWYFKPGETIEIGFYYGNDEFKTQQITMDISREYKFTVKSNGLGRKDTCVIS